MEVSVVKRYGPLLASIALLSCSGDGPSAATLPTYEGQVVSVYVSSTGARSLELDRDDVATFPVGRVIIFVDHPAVGSTLLRWTDGRLARWDDILVGQRAKVWTNGMEATSSPPQAYAERVALEAR